MLSEEELFRRARALMFQCVVGALIVGLFVFGALPMWAFRSELDRALVSLGETDDESPR